MVSSCVGGECVVGVRRSVVERQRVRENRCAGNAVLVEGAGVVVGQT
jgi:hypothetical protein